MQKRLKHLFEEEAPRLAREAGMRERTISFTQLALLLVLGWWREPTAGPSLLARLAGSLGVSLTRQTVDCHFTPRTASWLLALVRRAVQEVVSSTTGGLSWMAPFSAVLVEDGSTIPLPAPLAALWPGCGGGAEGGSTQSEAALKLTVRWDLKAGMLDGPHVQPGRQHEASSVLSQHVLPAKSLWLADLGYWSLQHLGGLVRQGVYFCMRMKMGVILWHHQQRVQIHELLAELPEGRTQGEWKVDVGATKSLNGMRVLAQRVPDEVAQQRKARLKEYARKHSKPVNPVALELAHWTILLTNLPVSMLTLEQAMLLIRARWQIELLFKLWKQDGLIDEWTSGKPWRILCEVYAKLLAMVIQHWFLLLSCWDDPHHSLSEVADVLRDQVPLLVHGLCKHLPLGKVIAILVQSVRGGCSIEARRTRLSTSRRIQCEFGLPLT